MLRSIMIAVAALAVSAGGAHGQWREQAISLLAVDADYLTDAGYDLVDLRTGSLRRAYQRDHFLTLSAGVNYAIVGECDEDCDDLDFELYDGNGNLIDYDRASDANPIVEVRPRWTGSFRLRVKMPGCDVSPCYYAAGIFAY